jgi:hypothetical protein
MNPNFYSTHKRKGIWETPVENSRANSLTVENIRDLKQDITRSESALSMTISRIFPSWEVSTSGSTTLDVVSETVSSFVVDLESDLRLSLRV